MAWKIQLKYISLIRGFKNLTKRFILAIISPFKQLQQLFNLFIF